MQTEADPRLKPASSNPALFSDDEEDNESTGSVDSNEETAMSLYETLNETLSNFDAAIGSDDAWAWSNLELAKKVFAVSVRLQNWKTSIAWIASQSAFMVAGKIDDAHAQELLSSLTSARPFLYSLLLSYFDDINTRLKNIRDDLSIRTGDEQAEPQKLLLEELNTAVQCICVQLAPISSFAESRAFHQGIPTIKSKQQENAAIHIEKEVQTPHEEEPADYRSQYDWNQKKGKRLRNDFVSSKREFSDNDLGFPSKEEENEKREAQSTGVSYGSDPNYHSSYDWAMGKWKRLRWNPTTSQWDFNDYWDGAPPTGGRRDSQQPVGITYSTTPTTGFSQAHIPYAGSSVYAQQQPHSYTSSKLTHAQSAYPQTAYAQPAGSGIEGRPIQGTYNPQNPTTTLHYETLDNTYFVRNRDFFQEGRVLAVLFTEPAGANATQADVVTDYNSSLSLVMLGGYAHTQVRRFIVVRNKKKFCYAVPIFSYQGQGTKKPGVSPQEHAIAYSYGTTPQLLQGEQPLSKAPICIVTKEGDIALSQASRIFFGIHHPIQYNVKVKDLGYVHPNEMPRFLGYWTMENDARPNRHRK